MYLDKVQLYTRYKNKQEEWRFFDEKCAMFLQVLHQQFSYIYTSASNLKSWTM